MIYIILFSANRHVGATNMNEKSSRSHSIFRVIIESKERDADVTLNDGAVIVSHLVCLLPLFLLIAFHSMFSKICDLKPQKITTGSTVQRKGLVHKR